MSDDIKLTVHTVPMLDTGIGREASHANDAELIAAHEAKRAAMDPATREIMDRLDAELDRRVLFGA